MLAARVGGGADPLELPRAKDVAWIVESTCDADGSCPDVDLAVGYNYPPFVRINAPVSEDEFQVFLPSAECLPKLKS